MKALLRIWGDIRQGENIDLYAAILAAFLIATLSLFNIDIQPVFIPLVLAVLGVLVVSALVNRHRLDEILAKIEQLPESRFIDTFPATFISTLASANDLWLYGFSHRRIIDNHYSLIEKILKRGGTVKFLLVHPDSHAAAMAAAKQFPRVETRRYRDQIKNSLEQLCILKDSIGGKLEIRTTDILPSFTSFAVDPDTTSGILYLAFLPFESSSEHRPKVVLQPSDGYPFHAFKRDMATFWENASVWGCDNPDK